MRWKQIIIILIDLSWQGPSQAKDDGFHQQFKNYQSTYFTIVNSTRRLRRRVSSLSLLARGRVPP
jgi:hypothetical protein